MKLRLVRHLWGVDLTHGLQHHLQAQESWWDQIWASHKARGLTDSWLTPEFGPPPYLHALQHTRIPDADLADVCDWMARRQVLRFASLAATEPKL